MGWHNKGELIGIGFSGGNDKSLVLLCCVLIYINAPLNYNFRMSPRLLMSSPRGDFFLSAHSKSRRLSVSDVKCGDILKQDNSMCSDRVRFTHAGTNITRYKSRRAIKAAINGETMRQPFAAKRLRGD